jgi:spoIIIJ-associated protein
MAGRVALDAEGYRGRRQQALEEEARRIADEVRHRGSRIAMVPMSARDRRSVHMALQSEPGVTTESEGERDFRRVVIIPTSSAPSSDRGRRR